MRPLRIALALAACVVAIVAIARMCVPRWMCNVEKPAIDARLTQAFEQPSDYRKREAGRAAIEQLQRCVAVDPADYEAWFLEGVAYEALAQPRKAIEAYEHSNRVSERAETYAAIAQLQYALGEPEAAYRNLFRASIFSLSFMWTSDQNVIHQLVQDAKARQQRLEAKRRGNF